MDASPEGEGRGQQRRWRPAGRQELGLARQTAFSPLPAVGPGLELPTTSAAGDSRVHRVLVSGSESTCPCRQCDCTSGVRVTSLWKRLARGVPAVSGTWRPPGRWQVGLVGFNSCGCQGPGGQSCWPGLDRGSEGEGTQLGLRVGGVGEPDPVGCEEKPCNGCGPGARGAQAHRGQDGPDGDSWSPRTRPAVVRAVRGQDLRRALPVTRGVECGAAGRPPLSWGANPAS